MHKPLMCKLFGHKTEPTFRYGDPRFVKVWSDLLGEAIWYEVFIHDCTRNKCTYAMEVRRWTREAARKMLHEEDAQFNSQENIISLTREDRRTV